MKLIQRVEARIGEPVKVYMQRKAEQGATIRDVSNQLDVSYTTCYKWKRTYNIQFNGANPFRKWNFK